MSFMRVVATASFAAFAASAGVCAAQRIPLQAASGLIVCNTTPNVVNATVVLGGGAPYRQTISAGACLNITVQPNAKSVATVSGTDSTGRTFPSRTIPVTGSVKSLRFVAGPCSTPADICARS